MARTLAELPKGSRITDYLSLGVVAKTFPGSHREVGIGGHRTEQSASTGTACACSSLRRHRPGAVHAVLLPGGAALFVGRDSVVVGSQRPDQGDGQIRDSQARTRLGVEPVKQLHDQIVCPIATEATKGAWYRGWRVVSLDGHTLDVADEDANDAAFGRPVAQRGQSAFPQIRFVSLVENGTHVLFGTQMAGYGTERNGLGQVCFFPSGARYAVPGGPVFLQLRSLAAGQRHGG